MEYLGLALFAEGPTDHRFLGPVLRRLCEDLCCSRRAYRPVEVSGVLELTRPAGASGLPRAERIVRAAVDAEPSWRILFIHADADGDHDEAFANRVAPALERLDARYQGARKGIAVVPVRETEAWVLADGDALRGAFGATLNDGDLGIPAPVRRVESIADPKLALNVAYAGTNPTGRLSRSGPSAFLGAIGERTSFRVLRHLPSFRRMEHCLVEPLVGVNLLQPERSL